MRRSQRQHDVLGVLLDGLVHFEEGAAWFRAAIRALDDPRAAAQLAELPPGRFRGEAVSRVLAMVAVPSDP